MSMFDACRGKKLQGLFRVAIFAAELHPVYGGTRPLTMKKPITGF